MTLMKCGHRAQGIDRSTNQPVCIICLGYNPGATEIETDLPDLTNRMAKCIYSNCRNQVKSSFDLPFFEYRPNEKYDRYYCGCFGWD